MSNTPSATSPARRSIPGLSAPMTTFGSALSEAHAEPEPAALVEVALEGDAVAREAFPEQRDVLAGPGEWTVAVRHPVPPLGHHRRRDADAQDDVGFRVQRLQGRACHRHHHRRAQLEREHAGAEPEGRRGGAARGEDGEGLRARRLRRPELLVAELRGSGRHLRREGRTEPHEAGEGDAVGSGAGSVAHGRETLLPAVRDAGCQACPAQAGEREVMTLGCLRAWVWWGDNSDLPPLPSCDP